MADLARPVRELLHHLLATSHAHIAAACDPNRDRADEAAFRHHCEAAQLAGMAAYLLDALGSHFGNTVDLVCRELDQLATDGEPLAEWVADQVIRRGVTWPGTDEVPAEDPCPYTHAHTRHFCGRVTCRDS